MRATALLSLLLGAMPGGFSIRAWANKPAPQLIARGKTVYQANCIACHNPDPKKPGVLGPEIFGSSKALLEARIMRAEYPPGYKPKRATHAMVALPQLKNEIEALHAFLNAQ